MERLETVSRCTARVVKHTNTATYVFIRTVERVYTIGFVDKGPAKSTPVILNGNPGWMREEGNSVIIGTSISCWRARTYTFNAMINTRFD